jgi:hypothetical protein
MADSPGHFARVDVADVTTCRRGPSLDGQDNGLVRGAAAAARELSPAMHVSLFEKNLQQLLAANCTKSPTEIDHSSQERGRPKRHRNAQVSRLTRT